MNALYQKMKEVVGSLPDDEGMLSFDWGQLRILNLKNYVADRIEMMDRLHEQGKTIELDSLCESTKLVFEKIYELNNKPSVNEPSQSGLQETESISKGTERPE